MTFHRAAPACAGEQNAAPDAGAADGPATIGVLGPVTMHAGTRHLDAGSQGPRIVLGRLALSARVPVRGRN